MYATSQDGSEIYYEVTGSADAALVFVHGWLGNARWWDAQRDAFSSTYRIVAMDLAGHGKSSRTRTTWTAETYAQDILAVVRAVSAPRVVLVGHSMSGGYATIAAADTPGLVALILVDTLKNLETMPTADQAAPMVTRYRADFADAVATLLPELLYGPATPPAVIARLRDEFLTATGDYAATLLEPLYRCDLRAAARRVTVPVRGIGTDLVPAGIDVNRRYYADYDYVAIPGFGHYPMLEAPTAFDAQLRAQLTVLGV